MTVQEIVESLDLQPHPEGGFYKEVYRSAAYINSECLPGGFPGKRNISTSIYYLLQKGDFSAFHRIRSDEIWHYYAGGNIMLHSLDPQGNYECKILGNDLANGAVFQLVIPAGNWFAAEPAHDSDFTLAGCTVAPGFDFEDFELAERASLINQYPNYKDLVNRLCR